MTMKKGRIITAAIATILLLGNNVTEACTNFLVTKGASKDGSTFVTYAADSHTLYGELYYRQAATYPAGTMMDIYEWDTGKKLGQILQAERTYSVVGNMNEHQLAIAETTYGGLEELGKPNGIIDYGSLIYITLQRAKNAREAIKVMSELLSTYGYASSGESFSIADPNEVWVMDLIGKGKPILDKKGNIDTKRTTKGAVWVAMRIPDGYVGGHANQARITTFPKEDGKKSISSKNMSKIFNKEVEVVYASDVISYARAIGIYSGSDEEFSFADTYNPLTFDGARFCEARVWAGFLRVNPTEMAQYEDYARGDNLQHRMPLWIKPTNQLSLDDVIAMMRDHYEGTSMDMTKDKGAGPYQCPYRWRPMTWEYQGKNYIHERATATQQTGFSFVAQCRGQYPSPVGGILWFGVDDTYSTCYVPMFCGITQIPNCFKEGNGDMMTYSNTSAFWLFNRVSNFAYSRYNDMIVDIQKVQKKLETDFQQQVATQTQSLVDLYTKDATKGIDALNKFSAKVAEEMFNAWQDLSNYLLVKYIDGNVKKEKDGKFENNGLNPSYSAQPAHPLYPEWFYKMIIEDAGENLQAK